MIFYKKCKCFYEINLYLDMLLYCVLVNNIYVIELRNIVV